VRALYSSRSPGPGVSQLTSDLLEAALSFDSAHTHHSASLPIFTHFHLVLAPLVATDFPTFRRLSEFGIPFTCSRHHVSSLTTPAAVLILVSNRLCLSVISPERLVAKSQGEDRLDWGFEGLWEFLVGEG